MVTGASSGIGESLARQLAPRVRCLVVVARRAERLEALKNRLATDHPGLTLDVQPCDLTDRAATDAMLSRVAAEHGSVDLLINNAGFGAFGVFDRADWSSVEGMLDLNVRALTYLTYRLSQDMVKRGKGGVLNISSGAGLTLVPAMAAYVATKHYVTGFTEGLRLDLAPAGVCVSQACPGPVRTEFLDVAGADADQTPPAIMFISADDCARHTLAGFEKGKALIFPGLVNRLSMWLALATPRWLLRRVFGFVVRDLRSKQLAQDN